MQATVVSGYPKIANHPGGQRLRRAIAQFDEGRLTQAQLDDVADEVTREVIEEQVAAGPARWRAPSPARAGPFAAEVSPKPVKALLPGPYTFAKLSRSEHHASLRDFTLTLASALNQEARAPQQAGAPPGQVNEPAITKN